VDERRPELGVGEEALVADEAVQEKVGGLAGGMKLPGIPGL